MMKKALCKILAISFVSTLIFSGIGVFAAASDSADIYITATITEVTPVTWQKEYAAMVDGRYLVGAYSGGINRSKPVFADIDADGDYDMFIGEHDGNINFYRNDGTPESPSWTLVTENYNSIDVGYYGTPAFTDIDNDGDYDMFIGEYVGNINFYRNDGTPEVASWAPVDQNYNSIDVGQLSKPTFCDIDNDGDYDMFIGEWDGNINFYRNDGTPEASSWTLVTENYNSIDIKDFSTPTFTDIDSDGDDDMFIGELDGNINFYENIGTPEVPSWTLVTENYNSIDVGIYSAPAFIDIDGDADYDMFIGEHDGNIDFYRNDGTPEVPGWMHVSENYNSIDAGMHSAPTFSDIDNDGDYDMFIGEYVGNINFYRNDGTPEGPSWILVTENYNSIDVGDYSNPTFTDIDNDGDYDMFIGEKDGNINFYRNDGTPEVPSWTPVDENYNSITNLGWNSIPVFTDIDNDGDYDMFIGEYNGNINFYQNDGTPEVASWALVTENYNSIDVGFYSAPTFVDIDTDGDCDMFIGESDGNINFYRNIGTPESPSWTLVTENYNSIDIKDFSTPTFTDIDSDGDDDMFVGEEDGGITFYRNMTIADNTPPIIVGLPDKDLEPYTVLDNAIDLWNHSFDAKTPHNELIYTITGNTNPECGVDIDSDRFIDIYPDTGWQGSSNVTVRVEDPEGRYHEDVFTVNIALFTPSNLNAIASFDSQWRVDLTWTDNSQTENIYKVYRKNVTAGDPRYTIIVNNLPANTEAYTDTDVEADIRYRYLVKAFNGPIHSEASNKVEVATQAETAPAVPSNLAASASFDGFEWQVDLTWTDNADNENIYKAYRKNITAGDPRYTVIANNLPANTESYTDTDVEADTRYRYLVKAFNGSIASVESNKVEVATQAETAPLAPSNLAASASFDGFEWQVDLIWTDNADNENIYKVYRKNITAGDPRYAIIANNLPANTEAYTDTDVEVDNRYRYLVKAFNGSIASAESNKVEVETVP